MFFICIYFYLTGVALLLNNLNVTTGKLKFYDLRCLSQYDTIRITLIVDLEASHMKCPLHQPCFLCGFIFTCNTVTSIKSMSTVYFPSPPIKLTPHWLNTLLHNACDSCRDQAWLHDRQHLNIHHNTHVNFTHTTWTLCHATVLEMRHLFHRHCCVCGAG